MTPLINGESYSYSQIRANVLGVVLYSIKSINYRESQEKTMNYGLGDRPHSSGSGTITTEGSLEIGMNDIEALRDVAPEGSLLKLPRFDIVVTYGNTQKVVTHVLKNVGFTDDGVEGSTGDTELSTTYTINFSHIKYR